MNNLLEETIHKDDLHWRIQGLNVYTIVLFAREARKDAILRIKFLMLR